MCWQTSIVALPQSCVSNQILTAGLWLGILLAIQIASKRSKESNKFSSYRKVVHIRGVLELETYFAGIGYCYNLYFANLSGPMTSTHKILLIVSVDSDVLRYFNTKGNEFLVKFEIFPVSLKVITVDISPELTDFLAKCAHRQPEHQADKPYHRD
jgi:hypothetical protein